MKLSIVVTFLAAAIPAILAQCTAQQRIATLMNITTAFNTIDFTQSAVLVDAMPLQADCPIYLFIEGTTGIQFAFDATTSKDFANVVRQVFQNVVATYTDFGNGTALMDAMVTLGLAHTVPLPVYAHVLAPIEFNLTTCQITELPAYVYAPVAIGGEPVNPPILPMIPGLPEVPGFREILITAEPAIGNPYGL